MFLVEIDVRLGGFRSKPDRAVAGLVDILMEELELRLIEPYVISRRVDDDVEMTVGVTVDGADGFRALADATCLIRAAFGAAGLRTGAADLPGGLGGLRSRVSVLQAA